jgi:ketopantoate reductase
VNAVVIGPGRIGCGFVGQLLRASGWDVTFIGRGRVVDLLRRHRRYVVRLVEGRSSEDTLVDGVSAVPLSDGAPPQTPSPGPISSPPPSVSPTWPRSRH